jgi:hypothetical protein
LPLTFATITIATFSKLLCGSKLLCFLAKFQTDALPGFLLHRGFLSIGSELPATFGSREYHA